MIKNINFPIKIADTLCESNLKSNCPFTRNRFNISFPASIINNAFTFLFRNILFEICDSLSIREKITRRREIGKEEGGQENTGNPSFSDVSARNRRGSLVIYHRRYTTDPICPRNYCLSSD